MGGGEVFHKGLGLPSHDLEPRYGKEGIHMGEKPGLGGQSPSLGRKMSVRGVSEAVTPHDVSEPMHSGKDVHAGRWWPQWFHAD